MAFTYITVEIWLRLTRGWDEKLIWYYFVNLVNYRQACTVEKIQRLTDRLYNIPSYDNLHQQYIAQIITLISIIYWIFSRNQRIFPWHSDRDYISHFWQCLVAVICINIYIMGKRCQMHLHSSIDIIIILAG